MGPRMDFSIIIREAAVDPRMVRAWFAHGPRMVWSLMMDAPKRLPRAWFSPQGFLSAHGSRMELVDQTTRDYEIPTSDNNAGKLEPASQKDGGGSGPSSHLAQAILVKAKR